MGSTQRIATKTTSRAQRGVSLIEACAVIAITSIVVGSSVPSLQGVIEARRLLVLLC